MKIVWRLILANIFLSSFINLKNGNTNPVDKNDLNDLKLKGKVKSLKESEYFAFDSGGTTIRALSMESKKSYIFDKKGKSIEFIKYNSNNHILSRYIYNYDSNGNKIQDIEYSYSKLSKKIEYNLKDKTSEGFEFGSENEGSKLKNKYDNQGKLIEENYYDQLGNLGERDVYKYDEKGNFIEVKYIMPDGSYPRKLEFKYDTNNKMIEDNYYFSDDSIMSGTLYKYDEKGNQIERRSNTPNTIPQISIYKYDSIGNMLEWDSYYKSKIGRIYTYKYEYDKNYNWIKRTTFNNGVPKSITEREITYY